MGGLVKSVAKGVGNVASGLGGFIGGISPVLGAATAGLGLVNAIKGQGKKDVVPTQQQQSRTTFLDPLQFQIGRQGRRDAGLLAGVGGGQANIGLQFSPAIARGRADTLRQSGRLSRQVGLDVRRLRSGRNEFTDALVRPLEQQIEARRSAMEQGLNQRGLFGPLAQRELAAFDAQADRQLSDARAIAENQALSQILPRQQFQAELAQLPNAAANQQLFQDLEEMGLGLESVRTIIASRQPGTISTGTSGRLQPSVNQRVGSVLGGFGTALDAFSRLGGVAGGRASPVGAFGSQAPTVGLGFTPTLDYSSPLTFSSPSLFNF